MKSLSHLYSGSATAYWLRQPPVFGPCLLWPNGWMDQDATWHGGRPRPRPHCARWGPSSPPPPKGYSPPIFSPCLLWPNGCPSQLLLSTCIGGPILLLIRGVHSLKGCFFKTRVSYREPDVDTWMPWTAVSCESSLCLEVLRGDVT